MDTFYLIRHGQKMKHIGDPSLTDLGQKQARLTGNFLSGFNIINIYSSPAIRAFETAEIIASSFGYKVIQNSLLKERVNWGDDPNQTIDDFLNMWNKSSRNRDWKPPVGDSSIEAGNRMLTLINQIISDNNEESVIVSHGGIIADCLLNLFSEDYLNDFIPNFVENRDALLSECSITKLIRHNENKYAIEYLANADHLK